MENISKDITVGTLQISADVINQTIADMFCKNSIPDSNDKQNGCTGFDSQFEVIKNAFVNSCSKKLTWNDIATRLSLIDLFYTTNLNRFNEFGLYDLTDVLFGLCCDSNGSCSDAILVNKVEDFVNDCVVNNRNKAWQSDIYLKLFDPKVKFGITKVDENDEFEGNSAKSLITKYLFFLLESYHSDNNILGFPIFDSIASELQTPLLKKLGGKPESKENIVTYICNMWKIVDCLKSASAVWTKLPTGINTQFGLLDYFLWRIGKCGRLSFSLLWTRKEKIAYSAVVELLNGEMKSGKPLDINKFKSLPARFQDWCVIYKSIKA